MESSGLILPKFIKFLTNEDTNSDELKLPTKILDKYGHMLANCLLLGFRNGYEIPVVLDEERGTLSGLSTLYDDFELIGGQMLLFDFNGCSGFNVYVIGTDLREIDYPSVVHCMQNKRPRNVSLQKGGLKFVNFVKDEDPLFDEFEPPLSFKKAFGMLAAYQTYIFSNGKKIAGLYNHGIGKFTGLSKFCSIVGIANFSAFNLILFSYEDKWSTTVSVFDDHFVEVIFPGTPLSIGQNSHNPKVGGHIEITVQPHHMYKYVYGVDISTEYEDVAAFWKRRDYITVYSGDRAWKLQVRSRGGKSRRTTIHDGWIRFRDDLKLVEGDVVVLECASNSLYHFAVQVIKIQDA
ncbi:uncharacterized protein LOC108227884 [Daucus carota subsp. sativus]|uniref:uncharacterized protein LOC108227884 n=1 Tax=Daucus carota subsp. sativus TaxID=79200 RepID=UPI0007F011BA|nr:PREDICTED: uncharacterized protein LOC108227884 isoform X2 [Daucus carota subsp. sativus]